MAYEGHDAMYTGRPSKAGKATVQRGYGFAEGDGVGFEDTADSMGQGLNEYGAVKGKKMKKTPATERSQ